MNNGVVFYRGPSLIDGAPIIGVATGLRTGASNSKTGPMVQIYILREDVYPLHAVQTGDDYSICGNCALRGKIVEQEDGSTKNIGRTCYVTLMHGPRVVYQAYEDGRYPDVPLARMRKLVAGRMVRVGAYGDPAAIPVDVWQSILPGTSGHTGYTHQWRETPALSAFFMASVDSEAEREEAKALGFRTFRVKSDHSPKMTGEGICPGSDEMGKAVQCITCMLCDGNRSGYRHDVVINVHGIGASHFRPAEAAAIHRAPAFAQMQKGEHAETNHATLRGLRPEISGAEVDQGVAADVEG